MAFHVFIEKAVDATPEGRARLAAAIAARFKLPEAQIAQYLQAGRFRVKSNVDESTARKFASELQGLGAIVTVEDAQSGAKLSLNAGAPTRVAPAPAPGGLPGRSSAPGSSAPAVAPSGQRFESGLAAAFGAGAAQPPTNLGALDNMAGISLSSLDGGADESFSGPVGLSAAEPPARTKLPTSAFTAPDEAGEQALDLVDESRSRPAKAAGTPMPMPAAPAPAPVPHDAPLELGASAARPRPGSAPVSAGGIERTSLAGMQTTAAPTPRPVVHAAPPIEGGPLAPYFVGKPRARLLAGAALALLLGFLPATFYAAGAEDDRYGKIRGDLSVRQEAANTPSTWEALDAPDGARPMALKSMERARSRIRSNFAVIWVLVSSTAAFVWFRKLT